MQVEHADGGGSGCDCAGVSGHPTAVAAVAVVITAGKAAWGEAASDLMATELIIQMPEGLVAVIK